MNSFISFFSSPFAEVITRTLLHSLWQSAGIIIALLFILRITPERHSKTRYFSAYASIMFLLVASGYTFIEGWQDIATAENHGKKEVFLGVALVGHNIASPATTFVEWANSIVAMCTPYVVMLWILGVGLFLFRLSGSWWYLYSLRKTVTLLSGELADQLSILASRLRIRRTVLLAESAHIHVPLVIGYLKPMLLIPVGFVSGLTTQQVEAIFIHELTHIKREDYLLNLIQSITEAIYFFNPFVWIISSIIRREREHCCDDAVIRSGGNAIAYVHALAHLEEHRMTQTTLALSAIGTKNQLLNRIKRIMEKSVAKNSIRERLIPAMLLIIGIVCASWVTISTKDKVQSSHNLSNLVESDTTIKKKNMRSATYSRKRVVTTSPDGTPHEETVEDFDGDEELRSVVAAMDFPHEFAIPPIPEMPAFEFMMPPQFDGFYADSIPPGSAQQWREFQEQFQMQFKEQFGDFYLKNQNEINAMLEKMQPAFDAHFNQAIAFDFDIKNLQERNMKLQEEHLKMTERAIRDQEEHMREVEAKMRDWEREHAKELKKHEEEMKVVEQKMKAFEKELKENLRKDGYLKEDISLHHMHWDDNGDIQINDIKIKSEHAKKYRELHSKYFDSEPSGFRYAE
jgi:bla regulator protein blaR1